MHARRRHALIAALALAPATAHAGALAAAKKAGFTHVSLAARGKVSVVLGQDAGGTGHVLLVDARGRVADAGEGGLRVGPQAKVGVKVAPFLGRTWVDDVIVSWSWSNGMGGGSGETHYLLRHKTFTLACTFEGSGDHGMEDRNTSTTVTVTRTGDSPLTWDVVSHTDGRETDTIDQLGNGSESTLHYRLGATGDCDNP